MALQPVTLISPALPDSDQSHMLSKCFFYFSTAATKHEESTIQEYLGTIKSH